MALPYICNRKFLLATLVFFFVNFLNAATDLQPEIKFESKNIQIGNKKLSVEFAVSPEQHAKGLMYRDQLKENEGMLFVFDQDQILSFWMKNTLIDLSIAYINKKLKIVDIQEMKATSPLETGSLMTYPSKKPAMYALEMPKGWFKKNNIIIGQRLKLTKK